MKTPQQQNKVSSSAKGCHSEFDAHHLSSDTRNTKGQSRSAAPGASGKGINRDQYFKYMERSNAKIQRAIEKKRQAKEQAYIAQQNKYWAPVDKSDYLHQRRLSDRAQSDITR